MVEILVWANSDLLKKFSTENNVALARHMRRDGSWLSDWWRVCKRLWACRAVSSGRQDIRYHVLRRHWVCLVLRERFRNLQRRQRSYLVWLDVVVGRPGSRPAVSVPRGSKQVWRSGAKRRSGTSRCAARRSGSSNAVKRTRHCVGIWGRRAQTGRPDAVERLHSTQAGRVEAGDGRRSSTLRGGIAFLRWR